MQSCLRKARSGNVAAVALLALGIAGCKGTPSIEGPSRMFPTQQEMAGLTDFSETGKMWRYYLTQPDNERTGIRNEFMAARMYAIDMLYSDYEHNLNVEGQTVEFWARIANAAMSGVASVTSVDHTVKALNAAINGVNVGVGAYNDTFFRKQLIHNLITAMRASRHERRAIIRTRMQCPATIYPMGLALSDIESYFRAGTLESGFIRLARTVTNDEKKAKGSDDVAGATASTQAKDAEKNAKALNENADATKADKPADACNKRIIETVYRDEGSELASRRIRTQHARPPARPPADIRVQGNAPSTSGQGTSHIQQ